MTTKSRSRKARKKTQTKAPMKAQKKRKKGIHSSQDQGPVLWALDPLSILSRSADFQKNQIQKLLPKHVELKTVSVVAPEDLYLPTVEGVHWGKRFDALLEAVTSPRIQTLWDDERGVQILSASSRKKAIDELIVFSLKTKASLILTQIHPIGLQTEKQRVSHFTQKLIEKSKVPVLTFREFTGLTTRRILFATDFSKKSNSALRPILSFAKNFGLTVIAYHNVFDPVEIVAEITGVSMAGSQTLVEYSRHQTKVFESTRNEYLKLAQKEKVDLTFRLTKERDEITPLILSAAENENADVIALGIESHPILRTWLSSAVRDLLEESKKPLFFVTV